MAYFRQENSLIISPATWNYILFAIKMFSEKAVNIYAINGDENLGIQKGARVEMELFRKMFFSVGYSIE